MINPLDFVSHHFQYWDVYTRLAKSVPLKVVIERKTFTYTSKAVAINNEQSNHEFELPQLPQKEIL
jgi:hypothetical protein